MHSYVFYTPHKIDIAKLNEEGTNLSAENNFPLFQMNALASRHQSESEEVWTNTAIYIYMSCTTEDASLEVKGQQGLIFPASHHSGPATKEFQSSFLFEVLLQGCHLDV